MPSTFCSTFYFQKYVQKLFQNKVHVESFHRNRNYVYLSHIVLRFVWEIVSTADKKAKTNKTKSNTRTTISIRISSTSRQSIVWESVQEAEEDALYIDLAVEL